MDAYVSFHFMHETGDKYPEGRSFVIKFDVTPDARLAAILKRHDDDFEERLDNLFDDELEIFGEPWETNSFDIFGWLTHDQDEDDDPLPVVQQVRDFFLKEGFRGGEITELSHDEFEQIALEIHAQSLEAVLNAR